ncbi:uncharacterized protein LOC135097080 isoform X2 [Scylla paramamosain]|uniref:uncharacterized protein LOC135094754 isoform X2 n=1 Tax=Scylla paramamosain TaxID=85552 RepID=UPI003083C01D
MPKTCMTMCCREGSPKSDTTIDETPEDNLWLQLGFTVDSETGVYCLLLNCSETGETVWKSSEPEPTSDNKESPGKEEEDSEDSLDTLNDTLDDMIQASQLHPQHPRSLQAPRVKTWRWTTVWRSLSTRLPSCGDTRVRCSSVPGTQPLTLPQGDSMARI